MSLSIRALFLLAIALPFWAQTPPAVGVATPLMTKDLPGIAGKEGSMVMVSYAPGASSASHRHNASTFVYVLEGSVVMQVKGGAPVTLKQGETFYETPDDIHTVSKNASATQPAKILVFFVKNKGAAPTVPAN